MNFVDPIRSRKKIAQIKNLLRGRGQSRNLLLFTVGINTALRISDLLQLEVGDFVDEGGQVKRRFWLREEKRGKRQEVIINDSNGFRTDAKGCGSAWILKIEYDRFIDLGRKIIDDRNLDNRIWHRR